jgi:hypothetical protein
MALQIFDYLHIWGSRRTPPPTGCSKRPDFSPAQPWRLFHPPALSLPRQPLRPRTRLVPSKAAASCHFKGVGGMIPTARHIPPTQPSARQDALYPERGPSLFPSLPLEEWPRLLSTARIERAQFHRARSASKEGTWPLLPHPSEAARCASTGIVPATPSSLFSIL